MMRVRTLIPRLAVETKWNQRAGERRRVSEGYICEKSIFILGYSISQMLNTRNQKKEREKKNIKTFFIISIHQELWKLHGKLKLWARLWLQYTKSFSQTLRQGFRSEEQLLTNDVIVECKWVSIYLHCLPIDGVHLTLTGHMHSRTAPRTAIAFPFSFHFFAAASCVCCCYLSWCLCTHINRAMRVCVCSVWCVVCSVYVCDFPYA